MRLRGRVPDMLERFSDQACRVVIRARDEARALNHNWIGTEHLMLGLIGEDSGMAAQVLESLGISLAAARWLVEVIIGRVGQAPSGQLQFTPRAAKVLELASGLSLGYDDVGSWHILLGLLREGDGVGAIVLVTLGADQNRVGLRVTQLLNKDRGQEAPGEGSGLDELARARLMDNPLARIDALDRRLGSVEHQLSLHPDLGNPDQQTMTVRRETAATVGMQEFETATGLRRPETQRPAPRSPRQWRLERATAGQLPLARELARLYAELDKLRAILRENGIDPGDDPA
jgi:ATP-dependent Clp protease ATP-binding subunit ClpA